MTRKEVLTVIQQNRGKDLFLITEEKCGDDSMVCNERVSKSTLLRNAKRIRSVMYSTYRGLGLGDVEGCNWYDEVAIFDTREPRKPRKSRPMLSTKTQGAEA